MVAFYNFLRDENTHPRLNFNGDIGVDVRHRLIWLSMISNHLTSVILARGLVNSLGNLGPSADREPTKREIMPCHSYARRVDAGSHLSNGKFPSMQVCLLARNEYPILYEYQMSNIVKYTEYR